MFEQIFGSKSRVKLMKVFLENPQKRFFVRELTRLTDSMINSIRRELATLLDIGFIVEIEANDKTEQNIESSEEKVAGFNKRRYYALNKNHLFRRELENLFSKEKVLVEKHFTDKLLAVGQIQYLGLSGIFVSDKKAKTDLLAIGNFNREKMQSVIKQFEKDSGCSINYTLMDSKEYRLRHDIADRFLNDIINNEQNIVIINNLKDSV